MSRGAHDGLRAAADADPRGERLMLRRRMHADALHGAARTPRPAYRRTGAIGLQHFREEIELVLEEHLVIAERVSEQGKRLGERATPENDLGAPVRERVERGEALEDADGVVRAEDRDCGAEMNAPGQAGN